MDYKEKYEQALKVAQRFYNNSVAITKKGLEDIFPELKESIDERIKKVIKQVLSESTTEKDECYLDNGVTQQEVFAWLEKQGEHANFRNKIQIGDKVTRNKDGVLVNLSQLNRVAKKDEKQGEQPKKHDVCDNCDQQGCCVSPCPMKLVEKQGEQKPTQEIEPTPIFKIGDILKRKGKDYTFIVDRIQGGYYHCDRNHGAFFPIEEQDRWELVEQKPTDKVEPKFKVGQTISKKGFNDGFTIEKIEDGFYYNAAGVHLPVLAQDHWELVGLKPAWSEEDDSKLKEVLYYIEYVNKTNVTFQQRDLAHLINWLKSLEERVQPKQEWSEDDEQLYNDLSDTYFYNDEDYPEETYKLILKRVLDWMTKRAKSLSPQNRWKPSDEQMEALKEVYNDHWNPDGLDPLFTLYHELKKLRED